MRTSGLTIVGGGEIAEFQKKHARSRMPLDSWYKIVASLSWQSLVELRETFRSADIISDGRVIFNIGGNKYRLVARVNFAAHTVQVLEVLTHAEYGRRRF